MFLKFKNKKFSTVSNLTEILPDFVKSLFDCVHINIPKSGKYEQGCRECTYILAFIETLTSI